MSNPYGDNVPPSDPPGANQPSSWDPLGPGAGSQQQPPPNAQGFPQQPYQQAHPQPPYAQPPYAQQPYAQPGYPPPVWVAPVPVYPYAAWIRRVGAYLIDFAPSYIAMIPFWIGYVMFYVRLLRASMTGDPEALLDGFSGTPLVLMGVGSVLMLAAIGWQWYNRWLVGGRTGQSMGKRMLDIKLVAEINGQPIGPVNAFLRDLLHVLDGMAYIGYLWPLWDAKRQTFSDMIMKTVVVDLRVQTGAVDAGHGPTPNGPAPTGTA